MKQREDFMESTEDNDIISEFVNGFLSEDTMVTVDYNYYSDGKHKMLIYIDEKDPTFFSVNAYTTKKQLIEQLVETNIIKKFKYISLNGYSDEVIVDNVYAEDVETANQNMIEDDANTGIFSLVLTQKQLKNLKEKL